MWKLDGSWTTVKYHCETNVRIQICVNQQILDRHSQKQSIELLDSLSKIVFKESYIVFMSGLC